MLQNQIINSNSLSYLVNFGQGINRLEECKILKISHLFFFVCCWQQNIWTFYAIHGAIRLFEITGDKAIINRSSANAVEDHLLVTGTSI